MAATNSGVPIYGTPVTVCTGSAILVNGTINSGETIASVPKDEAFCDLVLECAFATAPAAGKRVHVYRRGMNINGTGKNAPVPVVNDYEEHYVGSFPILNVNTTQLVVLNGVLTLHESEFYLKNDAGQDMSSGYVLTALPWSWGPAP